VQVYVELDMEQFQGLFVVGTNVMLEGSVSVTVTVPPVAAAVWAFFTVRVKVAPFCPASKLPV